MQKIFTIFLIFQLFHQCQARLVGYKLSSQQQLLDFATFEKLLLDFYPGDEQQVAKHLALFKIWDLNRDGLVSADEFWAFLQNSKELDDKWQKAKQIWENRTRKSQVSRQQRMAEFWQMDTDGDGSVDFSEYHDYMTHANPEATTEQLADVFIAFDANGDGFVSAPELFG